MEKNIMRKYRWVVERANDLSFREESDLILPCLNNKGYVAYVDKDKLMVVAFKTLTKEVEKLKGLGLKFDYFGELGEYTLTFQESDFSKFADVLEFRKQGTRYLRPDHEDNINLWLRVMQNISPTYKEILEQRVAKNRKQKKIGGR